MERKSRFTFLLANEDKRSAAVIAGIADALRGLPEDARRTVTFDRGTEFAAYPELARELAWPATSATRTAPGRKAASRTRTAASAASCPATASPRRSRAPASAGSPTGSTTPRGAASATARPREVFRAAPGGPDRPALTSPRHLSHFA